LTGLGTGASLDAAAAANLSARFSDCVDGADFCPDRRKLDGGHCRI
jgi:hypothetical protein